MRARCRDSCGHLQGAGADRSPSSHVQPCPAVCGRHRRSTVHHTGNRIVCADLILPRALASLCFGGGGGRYEHCGNHGLPLGLTAVGNLYKEGRLVDQDYTEAVRSRNIAPLTLCRIASSVTHNSHLQMRWFKRAASAGCMQAHVALGHMLNHGHGVEKDLEASLRHLRIAAEAGVAIAQHNVATCYQTGKVRNTDLLTHFWSDGCITYCSARRGVRLIWTRHVIITSWQRTRGSSSL